MVAASGVDVVVVVGLTVVLVVVVVGRESRDSLENSHSYKYRFLQSLFSPELLVNSILPDPGKLGSVRVDLPVQSTRETIEIQTINLITHHGPEASSLVFQMVSHVLGTVTPAVGPDPVKLALLELNSS